MTKNMKKFAAILLCILPITLTACKNSEQKKIKTRVEVQEFTKKVNEAIYAKDADYIIKRWNPNSPAPKRSELEHIFRGLNLELLSSNSKYKGGTSEETGKKIKSTNVYITRDPYGQATATIVALRSGKDKCCFINAINFDYKYDNYKYKKPDALREANKIYTARRQFHIEFKTAIFAKNTEFILKNWSPHAIPVSKNALSSMLNSIPSEFAPGDMLSTDNPAEINANRIIRHTRFSAKGEERDLYINLATTALNETECCFIESLGIVKAQKPN